MQIVYTLYPGFTALDVIGPFQVLADVAGHHSVFAASQPGPVPDHTGGNQIVATASLGEVHGPDLIVVPGGRTGVLDDGLVDWIRAAHRFTTWTTSVGTGAIYLAAAGLLAGVDATTHWAWAERLNDMGACYVAQPVVERGQIITSAGASSGIEMALVLLDRLYGPLVAQSTQLALAYEPRPPFNAGTPDKVPTQIVELVRLLRSPTSDWANTSLPR